MTLGISSVAKADLYVNWIGAYKKLDCPRTCGATGLTYPMFAAIDKNNKPISICALKTKDKYKEQGEWLVGYNRWEQKSCTVAIGDKVVHSERYYCLCHDNRYMQPLR
jgi:hypothetical protein